jgi:RNA polymerase sigma-70 factor (ECF subfamily)
MGISATAESEMLHGEKHNETRCESFLQEHMGLLFRVAASYEAIPSLREDLLQDIVLSIWQASKRFQSRSSFKTFALRVAHNRAITYCTRESRRPAVAELQDIHPDPADGPEKLTSLALEQEKLMTAVRQLPLSQRQIVGLALEGLSYAEISDVLGITSNNVGVRLNRAKKQLMELLND